MTDDIFAKRMKNITKYGSLGAKMVSDSNILEDLSFDTSQNFRTGMLYDWDLNELETVDFKLEKIKSHSAEGLSVEYMVHFRPDYNPEFKFKDRYYRNDGRERLGFYIDVYDASKKIYEKWLIVGKDDRVAFDRYNALKCDWCFEWVSNGKYYNCIGCVRSAQDGSVNNLTKNRLGGTSVNDELSIFLPSNQNVSTITLGTRFIISDNIKNPWVYEVIRVKDAAPLGATKIYLKQALFNSHTDYCGIIDEKTTYDFCFELPIEDLAPEYGGKYHMICNCIKSKGLPQIEVPIDVEWKLQCNTNSLYINGSPVVIKAIPSEDAFGDCEWHITIDGINYTFEELAPYFDISLSEDTKDLTIKAINKAMETYIVKIEIYNMADSYYDFVELEVKL